MTMYLYAVIVLMCFNVPAGDAVENSVLEQFPEFRELKQEFKSQTEMIKQQVERLRSELTTAQNKIAFYARLGSRLSATSPNQNVVFGNVQTNDGNAYNAATGIFTAPVKGQYLFSATVFSFQRSTRLDIFKNSNAVGLVCSDGHYGGDSYDQSTGFVVLDLQINDQVFARMRYTVGSGSVVMYESYSSFSGILIK